MNDKLAAIQGEGSEKISFDDILLYHTALSDLQSTYLKTCAYKAQIKFSPCEPALAGAKNR